MYDETTAAHYEAYRPPLHELILSRALSRTRGRVSGLDIGCGTGCSARALAKYCETVLAIDPSRSMLCRARGSQGIRFVKAAAENLPLAPGSVDVVTLAGSLNYIDRDALAGELQKVCRRDAEIVVYDFEVDLSKADKNLGIELSKNPTPYDHALNLDGFSQIRTIESVRDNVKLELEVSELVHLLLAESERYAILERRYQAADIDATLAARIRQSAADLSVRADIYFSVHTLE